jgi:ABC-2 type transport system permease protein
MKTLAIAKRLIKQISSDKRTVVLMFIAPIFICFLLSIILTSNTATPTIDVVNGPNKFIYELEKEAIVSEVNLDNANENLKSGKSHGYISFNNNYIDITVDGSNPPTDSLVIKTFREAFSEYTKLNMPMNKPILEPEISYLYGNDELDLFNSIAPSMMGYFIFFFTFLIAGVSFLRERISGTLDRILATPLKRHEIVFGYFLGFGLFISIQTVLLQLFMIYVLKIYTIGNFSTILIVNLLLAFGSLALGTLLSTFAKNEFQLFQFIPAIIVPQILFSGIFDISNSPKWVEILSKLFPMTYGAQALKNVALKGYNLGDIKLDILVLLFYAVLFLVLNILALKKYRKV